MPSPSTSTLRSGTVSRFSGDGAWEKSSRMTRSRLGACCWNGANRSPPGQPPPRCCCCRTGGPPKEGKLKNCADAGPAIPASSATATAISGPLSVKTRKKDFGFGMRFDRHGRSGNRYSSGIGPQAGRFCAIDRASAAAVKGAAALSLSRLLLGPRAVSSGRVSTPAQPLQHVGGGESVRRGPDRGLEAAQRIPGLAPELAVRGSAIEAALGQKLLQFQPLGAR